MYELVSGGGFFYGFQSFYRSLTNDKRIQTFEIANYIYSTFHALFSAWASYLFLNGYFSPNYYVHLLAVSPAFAIFDISLLIDPRNKVTSKLALIIHHLIIILVYILATEHFRIKDQHLEYVAFNFLSESSTPFLNLSIFLHKKNLSHTNLFKVNSFLVIIFYFIFRIVIPGYVTYLLYINDPYFMPIQLTLNCMNYFWFFKLCKKCLDFFFN